MAEVFGVTGWKNSGKTTLVARLVTEFTRRGLRVSTVKHAHDGFEIDHEGTDSRAHRDAGAHEVAIVSDTRWALIHEVSSRGAAPTLQGMLNKLAPCDLVLVEGYKASAIPKIECVRSESRRDTLIFADNASVVAIAADGPLAGCPLPQFDLDDVATIADYIAHQLRLVA